VRGVGFSLGVGVLLALCGAVLLGCPASADGVCFGGTCDPVTPGADGGGDGPKPDPCIDTPTDPACLDETTAIFVSAGTGKDDAVGTKLAPLKTVTTALTKVTADKKRIYVCEGAYAEKINIIVPVSIIGGLACDFSSKGATAPKFTAVGAPAITVTKTRSVALLDLAVETAAVQAPGASAVGILISESEGAALRRLSVKAGAGVAGTDGANGDTAPNYTGLLATNGNSSGTASGALAPDCGKCVDGTTFSKAGDGANSGGLPTSGSANPDVGSPNKGGTIVNCVAGGPGASGLTWPSATGATRPGTLSATGWDAKGGAAADGPLGNPGQGGGGGGSEAGAGGGSGGCGGCGGSGGKAGTNGGSSFAVLIYRAAVAIEDGAFEASAGGEPGDGGVGQDGQRRGSPGVGACIGGVGGQGAGGGGGGGGGGGHSVGIGYVGAKPDIKRAAFVTRAGGRAGVGGEGGKLPGNGGNRGGDGAAGTAAETLAL